MTETTAEECRDVSSELVIDGDKVKLVGVKRIDDDHCDVCLQFKEPVTMIRITIYCDESVLD